MQTDSGLSAIVGKSIARGDSSLGAFAVALSGDVGLLLEAVDRNGRPAIKASIVGVQELPRLSEAVCSVDWSWICNSTIKTVSVSDSAVRLLLEPVGPLTVAVAVWQGKPFLSFQPFKPAK